MSREAKERREEKKLVFRICRADHKIMQSLIKIDFQRFLY